MSKVFLGGTCNGSLWRDNLIKLLQIDYFNPVVKDWTEECMIEERRQREICDFCLYTITPLMTGVYSIAEVIDDSNKRPKRTIFCIIDRDKGYTFTKGQLKSLDQVGKMVERNGGKYFTTYADVADFLNNYVPKTNENQGLYQKYSVTKTDGTPIDSAADYFILRLDTDENARLAAYVYAFSIMDKNPQLARELLKRVLKYKSK